MPLIPLPDDVALKIHRAERLVRELDDVVAEFTRGAPTTLVPAISDPIVRVGDGMVLWGARASVPAEVPGELRAIVGDAVHNIRSALEYLARALVVSNGGTPVDGRKATQFPISDRAEPVVIQGGVDPTALQLVQGMQPGPDGRARRHPLAMLRDLSNEDKHRAPTVATAGTSLSAPFLAKSTGARGTFGVVSPLVRWLRDGEWAVMPFMPFPEGQSVTIDTFVRTVVTLDGDGPVMPSIVDDIDYLLRHVRDHVIPAFRPYFTEPWDSGLYTPAEVLDPLRTVVVRAMDLAGFQDDIRALVESVPKNADGQRPVLVLSLAEGANLDPRLLSM